MRKLLLYIAIFISSLAYADDIKFTASAPQRVIVGQPFQLVFSVNENGNRKNADNKERLSDLLELSVEDIEDSCNSRDNEPLSSRHT